MAAFDRTVYSSPKVELLLAQHRWKPAIRILLAAHHANPKDADILGQLCVAAKMSHRRGLAKRTAQQLSTLPNSSQKFVALAQLSLCHRDFLLADARARKALTLDQTSTPAWTSLSASYAGLGWFEESKQCLLASNSKAANFRNINPEARWRIGKAVNDWASNNLYAITAGIVVFFFFHVLALAVTIALWNLARDLRVMRIGGILEALAADSWRYERRRKFVSITGIATSIVAYLAMTTITKS